MLGIPEASTFMNNSCVPSTPNPNGNLRDDSVVTKTDLNGGQETWTQGVVLSPCLLYHPAK